MTDLKNKNTISPKWSWKSAANINRPFVKHCNPVPSPAKFSGFSIGKAPPVLSVVIPTSDGYRNGNFNHLISQIRNQDYPDFETIIIKGDHRQGRAINIGAGLARGNFILTLDDDTSLPDPETFSKMVQVLLSYPDIGIAGGNNVIPATAGYFIKRSMQEIPRRSWEPVKDIVDSDLAEHPCMIMRTDEFKALGGENELIPRGLDPYLRGQFRKLGKRVVVVPKIIYHHLPPKNSSKLLLQFYRNGCQAAFTNWYYPQWVIETPAGHGSFEARIPFKSRLFRFPYRLLSALINGKPLWFLCEMSYAVGFAHESWILKCK